MTDILLVEDDPFWQKVIRTNISFAAKDCRISCVTSGAEALDLLHRDHPYGLVVADQFLEGDMTGYELWRSCQNRGINVPFLLTSGVADFSGEELSDVHYIPKPFVGAELRLNLPELMSKVSKIDAFDPVEEFTDVPDKVMMAIAFLIGLLITLAVYKSANPLKDQWMLAPPPPDHDVSKAPSKVGV
jgi:CheY-like chemotaxis protein